MPFQTDVSMIMRPPGEAPYCSSQKQSLWREINCFVVDGKEIEESVLKCYPYLEELEGRSQVALSDPIPERFPVGNSCLGLARGLLRG